MAHLDDHIVWLLTGRDGHGLGCRYARERKRNSNRPNHSVSSVAIVKARHQRFDLTGHL